MQNVLIAAFFIQTIHQTQSSVFMYLFFTKQSQRIMF